MRMIGSKVLVGIVVILAFTTFSLPASSAFSAENHVRHLNGYSAGFWITKDDLSEVAFCLLMRRARSRATSSRRS